MENAKPFALTDFDGMISLPLSIFSELDTGLAIYHMEDLNEASSLKLVYANREASKYTGADLSQFVGKYVLDTSPVFAASNIPQQFAEVANTKQARNLGALEYGDANVEKGWFAVKAFSLPNDCVGVVFENITLRKQEELNYRAQAVIKEKCTAIHPAVEWRFRKAAISLIQKQDEGIAAEMEPIVFYEVYALYGVTDIRGSSTQRNAAIQADLIDHLRLAREIMLQARQHQSPPFFDAIVYRIDKKIAKLEAGLQSDDEMSILDFLRREVEPRFAHIQEFGLDVREKIHAYWAALEPQHKSIYRKRNDFEESVARINVTLCAYLDDEEEKAQAIFPHYFEKHKTDGIDHGIYVGASLVDERKFDLLYLQSLRLWQLMTVCGIARHAERLKASLKVPLETAHLILAQSTPLTIHFRFDEKQFDVDGAYSIRYEIMKKRIDKATIKGTAERLTQPGKIAIVYSQPREALEYREYIDYLHASGYLTDKVEEVELEDLQGVQGLKALRVTVDMQESVLERIIVPTEVEEAVKTMLAPI